VTQYSYSRVSLFENCPYHFKLRYIDKLTEIPDLTNAANPLIIGHALHSGIEHNVQTALDEYFNAFHVLTDRIVEEAIKLEILIPKVKDFLNKNFPDCEFIHEYKLDFDNYLGFVDLIVKAPDGTCMVIDFKYSNNIKNYLESAQLHIYKDYLEQDGFDVKKLAFLFVPKVSIKQKESEDLFQFRKRIINDVTKAELKFVPIEFDQMQTVYFLNNIEKIESTTDFSKRNASGNCFSCNPRFAPNFLEAIQNEKGEIILTLPKNERRERKIDTKPDFWLYADSYVGKSTFVDKIPNVLFFNTDGNMDNTTAPVISVKDEVKKVGRKTERTLAWEVFLDRVSDLETEDNDYEAVAIDLVEDLRDHCRVYVFEKNGWEHESDGGYGKGWDKVKLEFNNAIKRLKSLGYQLIYISKEIVNEITLKGGAKRTTFKPNIDDKTANFLTGTVDLTMRAYVNSDDERFLQLGKKSNVFGGGRFDFQVDTIPLDYDAFIEELIAAQEGKSTKTKTKRTSRKKDDEVNNNEDEGKKSLGSSTEEPPKRERKRRTRNSDQESEQEEKPRERKRRERKPVDDVPPGEEESTETAEEAPKRQRRTRKPRGDK